MPDDSSSTNLRSVHSSSLRMVTLHDSLVSSSARKLPIRKRPDLSAQRQHYLGRSYWVVKDPVG